jgi:ATP-binding cassette subfamily B protein
MGKTEALKHKDVWKQRLAALRDLPELWRLLWASAAGLVAGTIFLRVAGGLTPLGMLYAAKNIIDMISAAAQGKSVQQSDVWFWVGVEFGLAALSQVIVRGVDFLDGLISDRFSLSLGLKIMRHAATLDLRSFEDPAFHDRLARARAQSTDRTKMLTSAGWLLQRCVMLGSLAGGIVFYYPWLLVVLVVCVLPSFLVESHFAFLGYGLATDLTPARRSLDYFQYLGSSHEAAKEIKVFSLAPHLEGKYESLSSEIIGKNRKLATRRLGWGAAFAVLSTAGYYASYAYVAQQALTGRLSIGTFAFLAGAIAGANGHLQMIFSIFSEIADQALFLRDLVLFFHEEPSIRLPAAPLAPPKPIRSGFEFENVKFQYPGSDKFVLDGLNFRFQPGERIALVGENGEGKTTLVKLLLRLYDPTQGRILLDGKDLRDYDIDELRKDIGVIFQDFLRYDLPARENIAAGNIGRLLDDESIREACRKSNAIELVEGFPGKLDQMLGRRFDGGVELSGGEWQRIALARAYMRDAQVFVLDEPSAALDPVAESEVFQSFADLSQGRMALFISHRFSTVRMADRIVVLSKGAILEDGSHEDLIRLKGRYAEFFDIQAASYR